MRKNFFEQVLPAVVSAGLIFSGCYKNNMEVPPDETTPEISAADISETKEKSSEEVTTENQGYEPYQIRLYDNLGTGIPRPENYGEDMTQYYISGEFYDILPLLKDKEIAEKIRTETDSLFDLATESYHLYDDRPPQENIYTYCRIYNGYLFYEINYGDFPMEYCAVFDIRTGEHLELSDMFFEGEEFLGVLNKKLMTAIQQIHLEHFNDLEYIPMKREFAGLTEDGFYFDSHYFYFPVNNPYMTKCARFDISICNFDTVLNVPYDMTSLFEEDANKKVSIRKNNSISSENYAYSRNYETGNITAYLFDESKFISAKTAEFLAEQTENIINAKLDRLNEKYDWIMYTDNDKPMQRSYEQDGEIITYDENYIISSGIFCNNLAYIRCEKGNSQVYEKTYNLYYDLETLEPLSTEEIFERVYGDKNITWEHTLLDLTDANLSKWEKIFEENPPEIKSIAPENITFKYSDCVSYYEETDDYTVFWRAIAEQEEQQW
ncbi:MAG: hypothetical protein J1E40_11760 [Oscillospiraceae bacterium]|nr:hypothetical protein [Oscillospiraceae bacterium]